MPKRSNISRSWGTPSRVPSKVSTSTLRAMIVCLLVFNIDGPIVFSSQQVLDLLPVLDQVKIQGLAKSVVNRGLRFPTKTFLGILHRRYPGQHILVTLAVEFAGRDFDDLAVVGLVTIIRVFLYQGNQFFCQLPDRQIVGRIADVEYATVRSAVFVGNDFHQAVDTILDEGE